MDRQGESSSVIKLIIKTLDPKAFTDKVLNNWEAEIRTDERAKCDKEKAEFGLSVHEAAVALTLKEVGEWLHRNLYGNGTYIRLSEVIKMFKKGEMP